jgi:hypothetical protein
MRMQTGEVLGARPHPCPLPQEREKRLPRFDQSKASLNLIAPRCELQKRSDKHCDFRAAGIVLSQFPLPGGEGQGEGERYN